MPFETTCPHCGRFHDGMPDTASGSMVRCRGCFKPFTALALADRGAGAEEPEVRPPTPEPEPAAGAVELRAVVARLADVQRKCSALGGRHPEVAELGQVLDVVLRDLRAGCGPRGEPLPLRELALPLGSWARRLDRLGMAPMGRELAHVERTLLDAADRQGAPEQGQSEDREEAPTGGRELRLGTAARLVGKPAAAPPRRRGGVVGAVGVAALVVALVAAVLVLRPGPSAPLSAGPVSEPAAAPTSPDPTPQPTTALSSDGYQPPSRELAELLDAAGRAQLAAQRGDLVVALEALEAAARLDPTRAEVRAAAQTVVEEMAARAAEDEGGGRFDEAEARLLEAQRLAGRFLLDATALDARLARLRTAERTVRILPAEHARLREAVGRQVELRLTGREVREGRLTAVEEEMLVLEVRDTIGVGGIAYTLRVPRAQVELVLYRYRPGG